MSKLEFRRQIFHLLFGVVIVLLLFYGIINSNHIFFMLVLVIFFSLLATNYHIAGISRILDLFERKEVLNTFPAKGLVFYLLGIFLVLALFPFNVALPAILILAALDSFSHMFGLGKKRTKHPFSDTKSLEGMLAGFVAGFIAGVIFVPWYSAFAASLAAIIVEGLEIKYDANKIDDNVLIPLVAALVLFLIQVFV